MSSRKDSCVKNYAAALFALCKEEKIITENMHGELKKVGEAFGDNAEFLQLLCVPTVTKEEKLGMVKSVFKDAVCPLTLDFLCVLVENGEIGCFNEICGEFKKLYYSESHIIEATVTTASPLSDSLRQRLKQKLEKKLCAKIILIEKTDEALIGGIVVKYNDTQLDGSLSSRLSEMKKSVDSVIA